MTVSPSIGRVCLAVALFATAPAARAAAQGLRSDPFVVADGKVTISGDVAATVSCAHAAGAAACTEDSGFFNYSDYGDSTIRAARAGLSTAVRLGRQVSVLGDFRTESGRTPHVFSLFLRVKPFEHADIDIQAGRIPQTFGAFARHAYSVENPLIGLPLAYQYLTSLRTDALPADPDDLIRMRGRGWLSNFPIGNLAAEAGLPLVDALNMDTGVQVHGATTWMELSASVTAGSLSKPLVKDDNPGKQVAGRAVFKPVAGLMLGVSAARAPFVTTAAAEAAHAPASAFVQHGLGADVEYSRDHYLLRAETVVSRYTLPTIAPRLRAISTAVEGRYKFTPRFYAAARIDHMGFNTVTGATRTATWDAPVTRWETGAGYAVQRNAHIRVSFQHNSRDGGRVRQMIAVSGQLLYWF